MSAEAFLRAIALDPEDDTSRLVYADWLDEHGDGDRAEFIRTQIALASGSVAPGKRRALEKREAKLLAEHAEEWVEPLSEFIDEEWAADVGETPYVFRRGFVEQIDAQGETLIESGSELFAAAPIRGVRLPVEEDFTDLARCKHLLRLHSLDLSGSPLNRGSNVARLFRSRYLANLTTLVAVGYCGWDEDPHLDVAGLRAIAGSKYLAKLKHLDVCYNWFGPKGTVELLKAANLTSLERLRCEDVALGDEGAVALAASPWIGRLKQLDLAHNLIGERGMSAVLESPFLEKSERLDLRHNLTQPEPSQVPEAEPVTRATLRALRQRFGKRVLL
jgi:uncharacterized protein (TIGR02996 family)